MLLETGAAAALFVATFLTGGRMHSLRLFAADRRSAARPRNRFIDTPDASPD